jgi:hypothetical protein
LILRVLHRRILPIFDSAPNVNRGFSAGLR